MTAPAEDSAPARSASAAVPSGPGIPRINPVTGLSTDYLNHFTEAVMALEMAGDMPECLADLRAWQPKSYVEHFAASHFRDRDAVIRAYRAADPAVRAAFDAVAETLNIVLAVRRDAVLANAAAPSLDDVRSMLARMAALINGTAEADGQPSAQAEIDAMFGR
jgi:hypothetical protein